MTGSSSCLSADTPESSCRNFLKNTFQLSTFRGKTIEDEIGELQKYHAHNDALFLAELYHEKENTEHTLYVFSDCLMRANKKEALFGMLSVAEITDPKLRFLFAKCAYDLNKIEACRAALLDLETGLIRAEILGDDEIACHAHVLHAALLCDEAHISDAIEECEKALEMNFMMWSAICAYIKYGGTQLEKFIEPHRKIVHESKVALSSSSRSETPTLITNPLHSEEIAKSTQSLNFEPMRRTTRSSGTSQKDHGKVTPSTRPERQMAAPRKSSRLSEIALKRETTAKIKGQELTSLMRSTQSSRTRSKGNELDGSGRASQNSRSKANPTLSSDTENVHTASTRSRAASGATPRGTGTTTTRGQSFRMSLRNAEATKTVKSPSQRKKDVIKQPLSSRNSNLVRSLSGSTNSISSMNDEKIEQDDIMAHCVVGSEDDLAKSRELSGRTMESSAVSAYSVEYKTIFSIYCHLAMIEEAVGTYNWTKVDYLVGKLEKNILTNSSVFRIQLGRACFEQAEYGECRTILEELHRKKPWRVEGMELLSTSLWHLQDTNGLSALAQTLTSDSRERPQSWCAAGNCFSLQRQHTQAVECMERAIQLDRRFAYAHTLLGHELIVQDELDKAAGAFRAALLLSPRDYRSWYGLGLVHLKKEQNNLAQTNIQKAVSINPTNRAMLCTLSQVEQQRGQTEKAILLIDRALELNPTDVACRFNRARLLFEAKRNDECLEELNKLKSGSPDEAFVFHLLARVHRRIGSSHLALLNYSWAAELDPRGDQNIGETSAGPQNREEYEDDEYGSPV